VSVVIPCLNRAHFLVPTIESVLQQNYPFIECIVVDGGSRDGTLDILKRYNGRLRWVSEPDRGHADAINKGWQMSRGDILAWLNADDCWVVPQAVTQAVEYLQAHQSVDVVYGESVWLNERGDVIGAGYWREWDLDFALEWCNHCIPQPAAFIRRQIVERVGWLDVSFISKKDHELWLRIGLSGTIRHVPMVWAQERACPGTWGRRGDITAAACLALTEKFFRLPDVPVSLEKKKDRAMSAAYLRGAWYAVKDGAYYGLALRYILKGLRRYPGNVRLLWHYVRCRIVKWLWVIPRRWERAAEACDKGTGPC